MPLIRNLGQTVNNYGLLGGDRLSMAQGALQHDRQSAGSGHRGPGIFRGSDRERPALHARRQLSPLAERECWSPPPDEPVLSATGQPIAVPPGEVSVGADGVLSVAGGAVATVGVFTFPAGTQLTPEGANRYVAPAGAKPVARKPVRPSTRAPSKRANQDVVQGTLDLIVMQRQAEMMQKALTVFHTEFNKFATEDLPRV